MRTFRFGALSFLALQGDGESKARAWNRTSEVPAKEDCEEARGVLAGVAAELSQAARSVQDMKSSVTRVLNP